MANINFNSASASDYNEVFVPQIIESEGIAEGKEIHKLVITPDQFTKQSMYDTFNIPQWVSEGFTYNDQISLYVPTKEIICSHMVTVSHIMRFNAEFNRVVAGTTQMYPAQNPNHDKGKYTEYDKTYPLGIDGKKTQIVGRGLIGGLTAEGGLDYDNLLLSKYFSHAEADNTLVEALEDIFSNTLEGESFTYSSSLIQIAAVYKASGNLLHINKTMRADVIKATKRTEIAITSVFSFNWEDYGIESSEDLRIGNIHNANRNRLAQYLGSLAKASGVQVGQYAQFVVMGFAYSANTIQPKLEDKYENKAAFVRYHHNVSENGGLPAGVVILCKPVKFVQLGSSGSVGNANSKSRLLKALGKRSITPVAPIVAPAPVVEPKIAPLPFVMSPLNVTLETVKPKQMSLDALESIDMDEFTSSVQYTEED